MALYLVQHGKSSSKDVDPERSLTAEGREETERIAGVAAGYGVVVSAVHHSGKTRARQTAEIYGETLRPGGGLVERSGLAPLDDVVRFSETLDPEGNLMLVGHLPFMERLASHLVTASAKPRIFAFQNSGLVCLDRDPGDTAWFIKWALMPKVG